MRTAIAPLIRSAQVEFRDNPDVIELLQCKKPQIYRYRTSLLQSCTKALAMAAKVMLRMNERGFLSLQFMIPAETGPVCYVEYTVCRVADGAPRWPTRMCGRTVAR